MNKSIVPVLFVSILLVGIATTQATQIPDSDFQGWTDAEIQEYKDVLVEVIPVSYEAAVEAMDADIPEHVIPNNPGIPTPTEPVEKRFIMWTYDGKHVLWGTYEVGLYGNGYFAGEDNEGMKVWGIFDKNKFAGFYGENYAENVFYGRYYSNGQWKATGLFDKEYAWGNYVLFPQLAPPLGPVTPLPIGEYVQSQGLALGNAYGHETSPGWNKLTQDVENGEWNGMLQQLQKMKQTKLQQNK